tara:strand:+ start:3536 stop:4399 length:864 start_codon:yes stop_codon:yes gene_type:complete
MIKIFAPNDSLKNFVLFFHMFHWTKKESDSIIKHRCLPTGCSFLGFQREGSMQVVIDDLTISPSKYYLNAQTTVPYFMQTHTNNFKAMVACLKPTSIYHLFKISPTELVDASQNPKDLFGDLFNRFETKFLEEENPFRQFLLVQKLITDQIKRAGPKLNIIDIAIDYIIIKEGKLKVKDLLSYLNVSERHFQKKFKSVVGIPPYSYIQIIRINFIFSYLRSSNLKDCKTITAFSNFYDVAHFSKVFKNFMGIPPSEFNIDEFPFLKLTAVEQALWITPFQALMEKHN